MQAENFICNICRGRDFDVLGVRIDKQRVVACRRCGMGVLGIIPDDPSVFYAGAYYGGGADKGREYENYDFAAVHALTWAVELAKGLAGGGKVLDVGCANGFLLRKLSDRFETFGIEMNEQAAGQVAQHGVQVISNDVFEAGLDTTFRDNFDIVTSIATFEHVKDFRRSVELCLASLKSNGILIFEVPLISETADNSLWFKTSLEHIYYPTRTGIEHLFDKELKVSLAGIEARILGFASNYIGIASRDAGRMSEISYLLGAMTNPSIDGLTDEQKLLNLAYNVLHRFNPTPETILALPMLFRKAAEPAIFERMMQLWHTDAVALKKAIFDLSTMEARHSWQEQQTQNWRKAHECLMHERDALRAHSSQLTDVAARAASNFSILQDTHSSTIAESEVLKAEIAQLSQSLERSRSEASNWRIAHETALSEVSNWQAAYETAASEADSLRAKVLKHDLEVANAAAVREAHANALAELSNLRAFADAMQKQATLLDAELRTANEATSKLQSDVWSLEAELHDTRLDLGNHTEQLQSILTSTTWRATSHLRNFLSSRPTIRRNARLAAKFLYSGLIEMRALSSQPKGEARHPPDYKPLAKIATTGIADAPVNGQSIYEKWPEALPTISIVVNGPLQTSWCINLLGKLEHSLPRHELLVVESDANEKEVDYRHSSLRRCVSPGDIRNEGDIAFILKWAFGKYVCFLQCDEALPEGYLEASVSSLERLGGHYAVGDMAGLEADQFTGAFSTPPVYRHSSLARLSDTQRLRSQDTKHRSFAAALAACSQRLSEYRGTNT